VTKKSIEKTTVTANNTKFIAKLPASVQKKLSNPISTGGAGASYESRVQAYYLLAMYAGLPTPIFPEATIVCLQFQAKIHNYETDDLVCTLKDQVGNTHKVLIQVKRTVKAVASNPAFSEALTAAWLDFKNPLLFLIGQDRLVLAYDSSENSDLKGVTTIANYARTSLSGEEFFLKSTAENFSSEINRKAYKVIVTVITDVTCGPIHEDELHHFLKHLWFVAHDLSSENTQEYSNLLGNIEIVLGKTLASNPQGIWAELVNTCQKLNSVAGSVSFVNLDEQISSRIAAGFKLHREGGAATLALSGLTPEAIQRSNLTSKAGEIQSNSIAVAQVQKLSGAATSAPIAVVLSSARSDSVNKIISGQLDAIGGKLGQCHYRDAQLDITAIGRDLGHFDEHQKARWYQSRGICSWHIGSVEDAAADFIKAAELSSDDEKMVASRVRGLMLLKQTDAAIDAGEAAIERFPESRHVWIALASAKMMNDVALVLTDAPASIRGEADVLQILAWGNHFRGNSGQAIKLSLEALQAPSADFYTRHAALSIVVEAALKEGVLSLYQLIHESVRNSLLKVTEAFNPRVDKLWHVQAPATVITTASYLGCAYLLLDDANTALIIVQEAAAHGNVSPTLLRLELDALRQLDRTQELLKKGRLYLTQLAADGLVELAQAAGSLGDVQLVDECIEAAENMKSTEVHFMEILQAIRWMSNLHTAALTKIIIEIKSAKLESSDNLSLIAAGARVLFRTGEIEIAKQLVSHAGRLVEHSKSTDEILIFAELLFETKKFERAIRYYERILPKNQHSELHNRLLCCYLKTSATQKAKHLLESFPPEWAENDDTRSLAIEMAKNAGDYQMLSPLADTQFKKTPTHVSSWLFKFLVDVRRKSVSELQQFIKEAPFELNGSLQQTAQFARLELKYDLAPKAMLRMYRLRRLNINDIESASALVTSFIAEVLPNMEKSLAVIGPGVSVSLRDQHGAERTITIDPLELEGLPATAEFWQASSADAKLFMGAVVGSTVTLGGPFGTSRKYTVEGISSAYCRLLQSAYEAIDESVAPVANMMSISIPTSANGEADFSQMQAQLQRSSNQGKQVLTQYENMPLTLGCVCRILGKSSIDLVRSWPSKGPALISCNGTPAERDLAKELLENRSMAFVIDSATLTELVWLESAQVLALLPDLYVSATTRDTVRDKLEEAKQDRSAGQAFDNDGKLGYIEYTEANHLYEIKQLEIISAALDQYCKVLPAYGPASPNEMLVRLKDLISHEEYSSLILAAEKEAVLITLDGRLRHWAAAADVRSVWPQVLLMHASATEVISQEQYSLTAAKLFMANRSFTSLTSYDILMMCYQGDSWLRFGFGKYVRHLSHPNTDFSMAHKISLEFLYRVANSLAQLGALAELLKHIVAGLLRHKYCPSNFITKINKWIAILLEKNSIADYYPPSAVAEQQLYEQRLYILENSVRVGEAWAKEAEFEREIKVNVLMCGYTPWLVYRKD
jgi:tetratricopeptide (TPR) repeat protein